MYVCICSYVTVMKEKEVVNLKESRRYTEASQRMTEEGGNDTIIL